MDIAGEGGQPRLVYERVEQNRRKTRFLIALAVFVLLPCLFVTGYLISRAIVTVGAFAAAEVMLHPKRELFRILGAYGSNTLPFTLVAAGALAAVQGILLWAVASSPGSKILAHAGARPPRPEEGAAQRLLENLAIAAGLPAPKLFVVDATAPNAFATGSRPEEAAVAVTTGALALLDRRELEGVLAHELSHIGNHDIRLNSIVAAMVLFLRSRFMIVSTLCVGPVLASFLRASISREREFLADADAILLTRYPEGLMRALAKIGSAGPAIAGLNRAYAHFCFADPTARDAARFIGEMLATHPPIERRIQRLTGFQGMEGFAGMKDAVQEGERYRSSHAQGLAQQAMEVTTHSGSPLTQGNPMGRVFRVLAEAPVPVHDHPDAGSFVVAHLQPGQLVVAFDDLGPFREVNTAEETFGYISRSVKLLPVPDLIPAEVYNPQSRAAAEARLVPLTTLLAPPPKRILGLTPDEIFIALLLGVVVFAGTCVVLLRPFG
jgi:heat shock protein HtpX